MELMLADLESLEKRVPALEKRAKVGADKESANTLRLANIALALLREGRPARAAKIDADDEKAWHMLQLLTSLPALYVCNVDEGSADKGNKYSDLVAERAAKDNAKSVVISAQIESEIALLDAEERAEFLETLGLEEPGLNRLIREAYELLEPADLFHGRAQGSPRLDHPRRRHRPAGGRRHPHRLREGLHPRRDHRLRRLHQAFGRRKRREGSRQDAGRRQGLCRQGRRRDALPVQRLSALCHPGQARSAPSRDRRKR